MQFIAFLLYTRTLTYEGTSQTSVTQLFSSTHSTQVHTAVHRCTCERTYVIFGREFENKNRAGLNLNKSRNMLLVLNFSDVLTRPFHEHGAWPMAWPGLRPSRPQAVFEVSDFLTRGLALAWPQAADSGRRRPWLDHGLRQPIDTVYYTKFSNRFGYRIFRDFAAN
jgi:hypothetical protein